MTHTQWEPRDQVPKPILDLLKPEHGDAKNYNYITAFYQIVSLLKQQKRTGWIDKKVPDPESIADHMYRMSIIAMSLNRDSLEKDGKKPDLSQCVKIALVHDIAESLVGDIVPHDVDVGKEEKHDREYRTIQFLSETIKPYNEEFSKEITNLWLDYEYQRTLEGTIVKDIDKYELLIQTFEYERLHNVRLDEFFSCRSVIKHIEIQNLADKLLQEREEWIEREDA
ncbi:DEKNAAC103065 [Brettanomyces naardenensis]|uniref:5'-deoxynucleotidase n=1 Tax=Brettanomyces naardenensis TaxID=13370 RepID=A0A448YMB7_BRENA|nr:DEKNAAC103065 [Brettanomyces naardenensis]